MDLLKKPGSRSVAISLEGELVRVAHISREGGSLAIDRAETFPETDLDRFLKTTKERDFIIVNSFRTFHQAMLTLPPAKDLYLRTLAEVEIRKRFTEVEEFSFFHEVLGESQHEGKRVKDTFVFAVDYREVVGIIERFNRYGRNIVALYPAILPLAAKLRRNESLHGETVLAVLDLGTTKTLFLLNDGRLCFVRVTRSDSAGIGAPDLDNINMTINYCRQTLRLSPSRAVFIGPGGSRCGPIPGLIIPYGEFEDFSGDEGTDDTAREYILPLSAAASHPYIGWGNLLPPAYQTLGRQRSILTYSTVLLLIFSLLGVGSMALTGTQVSYLKQRIAGLRAEIAEKEPLFQEYEKVSGELQSLMPVVDYMNRAYSSPDAQKALLSLGFLPMRDIKVGSVQMNVKDGVLGINLKGGISAGGFAEMDARYTNLIESIKSRKEMEIVGHSIEAKEMTFSVDIKWKQ